jgi:hypothetical protein
LKRKKKSRKELKNANTRPDTAKKEQTKTNVTTNKEAEKPKANDT